MKKIYLLLALPLLFTSCKKDSPEANTKMQIVDVEVKYDKWLRYDIDPMVEYDAIIDVPEITSEVYEKGAVFAYLYNEGNNGYMAIPMTITNGYGSVNLGYVVDVGSFWPVVIYNFPDIAVDPPTYTYRLVIFNDVPPVGLNGKSYEEVVNYSDSEL